MVSVNTIDRVVGGLLIAILGIGIYSWIRTAFLVQSPTDMMGLMPRTGPIWYLFGTHRRHNNNTTES